MIEKVLFGSGCFWGAERKFWQLSGVIETVVGYAGGKRLQPNYEQVCSGATGHVEVVSVTYDSSLIYFSKLLAVFWESHDPTQGHRQGNDIGSQYRSVIWVETEEQRILAEQSKMIYQSQLVSAGYSSITTDIGMMPIFYQAEMYHQKYLQKNPNGYCGLGGTGVLFNLAQLESIHR